MKSIAKRLFSTQLIATLALAAVVGLFLYLRIRSSLLSQYDDSLRLKAKSLAALMHTGTKGFVTDFVEEAMPEFSRSRVAQYLEVLDGQGHLILRSKSLGNHLLPIVIGPEASRFENVQLPNGNPARAIVIRFVPYPDLDAIDATLPPPKIPAPEMILVFARDRDDLDDRLETLLASLAMGAVVMAVGIVLVTMLTVKAGLKHLRQFAAKVETLDVNSLDTRFNPQTVPAELQPISTRLNELLGRLQEAFTREKRFTSNAAHELRTPIAELRTLAEVALREDTASETGRAYFQDALDIAKQMESLVKGLLTLARNPNHAAIAPTEQVNVSELVTSVWNRLEPRAAAMGLHTTHVAPPELIVTTDSVALTSIVTNLFSNAIEYTPENGQVAWAVEQDGNSVLLKIRNTAGRLTADDIPHMSEPFWRKDSARHAETHSGLGLTLVKAWASIAGATVAFDLMRDHVLQVTVTMKWAGPQPASFQHQRAAWVGAE